MKKEETKEETQIELKYLKNGERFKIGRNKESMVVVKQLKDATVVSMTSIEFHEYFWNMLKVEKE